MAPGRGGWGLLISSASLGYCRVSCPTYSGNKDGWTFRPPYLADARIRGGTKSPKDTTTTRFVPSGSLSMLMVFSSQSSGWTYIPFPKRLPLVDWEVELFCEYFAGHYDISTRSCRGIMMQHRLCSQTILGCMYFLLPEA